MRMLWLAAVVAAAGAGCTDTASAASGPTQVAAPRTIVAFGDSLTAGKGLDDDEAYPAVLERMLMAAGLPFSVKNHGVSGTRPRTPCAGSTRRSPNRPPS